MLPAPTSKVNPVDTVNVFDAALTDNIESVTGRMVPSGKYLWYVLATEFDVTAGDTYIRFAERIPPTTYVAADPATVFDTRMISPTLNVVSKVVEEPLTNVAVVFDAVELTVEYMVTVPPPFAV